MAKVLWYSQEGSIWYSSDRLASKITVDRTAKNQKTSLAPPSFLWQTWTKLKHRRTEVEKQGGIMRSMRGKRKDKWTTKMERLSYCCHQCIHVPNDDLTWFYVEKERRRHKRNLERANRRKQCSVLPCTEACVPGSLKRFTSGTGESVVELYAARRWEYEPRTVEEISNHIVAKKVQRLQIDKQSTGRQKRQHYLSSPSAQESQCSMRQVKSETSWA